MGIAIPDLQPFCRAIVTKMAWYCHQNRQADQWYRLEDTETNTIASKQQQQQQQQQQLGNQSNKRGERPLQ